MKYKIFTLGLLCICLIYGIFESFDPAAAGKTSPDEGLELSSKKGGSTNQKSELTNEKSRSTARPLASKPKERQVTLTTNDLISIDDLHDASDNNEICKVNPFEMYVTGVIRIHSIPIDTGHNSSSGQQYGNICKESVGLFDIQCFLCIPDR